MRAATLVGRSEIAIETRDKPEPSPGLVTVKVDLVGLCGSDLSYFSKGANGDFVVAEPLVLGHEVVGTVMACDAAAEPFVTVGDRVAIHPAWPSPLPGEAEVRAEFAAERRSFLGSASTTPHTDGGLQEFLVVHPEQLRVIPASLDTRCAILAEPTAVALHALAAVQSELRGADIMVCGAGPIGLVTLLALRDAGAARVTVTDVRDAALELASELGATAVVNVATTPVPDAIADVVVEASGVAASLEAAIRMARVGGAIVQLGMLPRDQRPIALAGLVTKELRITGSHRFAGELDDALALLERFPEAAHIVRSAFTLTEASDAFAAVGDPTVVGKVVVNVGGAEL